MKAYKIFSIVAVAALLLAPTAAMAKTKLSISLNLFDSLAPRLMPAPVMVVPARPVYYYVPLVPQYPYRPIVKKYYFYHPELRKKVEEKTPIYNFHPQ